MHDKTRRIVLGVTLVAIIGSIYGLEHIGTKSVCPEAPTNLSAAEASLPCAPSFQGATGWLNTAGNQTLALESLRGQVVIVDFWTYSCINCIHTLPHVTKLYDTYHDSGLTVIGVHTPEFGFERERANVQDAIARYGIHYPVAQDNQDSVWNAYHNHYWPADYTIDGQGRIRFTHFGEGGYAESEQQVRQLLLEAGHTDLPAPFESNEHHDLLGQTSPELYAAAGRSSIANPEGYHSGQTIDYAEPSSVPANRILLSGTWVDGSQSVTAQANASVQVRFDAAAANTVLAGTGCAAVEIDGAPIAKEMAGRDVSFADPQHPCIKLDGSRSYDFYAGPHGSHLLRLRMPAGVELYTFDFTP